MDRGQPPTGADLVRYRKEVVRRQAERRAAAAITNGVTSPDLAGGEIAFATKISVVDSAQRGLIEGKLRSDLGRLRDSLGITEVEIIGYVTSEDGAGIGRNRAEKVCQALAGISLPCAAASSQSQIPGVNLHPREVLTPDASLRGRVAVQVRLPRIVANYSTAIASVQFGPDETSLNSSNYTLVGTTADQLQAMASYRNGAMVEVIGQLDGKDTTAAALRAAALKNALVEQGIRADQVIATASRVPVERAAAPQARNQSPLDPFALRADGPPAAIVTSAAFSQTLGQTVSQPYRIVLLRHPTIGGGDIGNCEP
jgi:outer membrane protein OmpA-like peptidoglycan-associated protein